MIIITRHAPLVAYLYERRLIPGVDLERCCTRCGGPVDAAAAGWAGAPCNCETVRVIPHATAEDVRGQDVIGVLPLHLAALCASVTEVPLALTPEDRVAMQTGDLTIERLREIAGAPVTYKVTVLPAGDQRESCA